MGLLANLSNTNLEKEQDTLGGFGVLETGIYTGIIKNAYLETSTRGALGCTIELDLNNGSKYSEKLWVTNAKGENFYVTKDNKKKGLPGFVIINDICLCAVGKSLADLDSTVEKKVHDVYDFQAKAVVKKNLDTITGILGKEISVAVEKQIVNKRVKNDAGEYVPSEETREQNAILKALSTSKHKTVSEILDGKDATWWDQWLAKHENKTNDKTVAVASSLSLGTNGNTAPVAPAANPFA